MEEMIKKIKKSKNLNENKKENEMNKKRTKCE